MFMSMIHTMFWTDDRNEMWRCIGKYIRNNLISLISFTKKSYNSTKLYQILRGILSKKMLGEVLKITCFGTIG